MLPLLLFMPPFSMLAADDAAIFFRFISFHFALIAFHFAMMLMMPPLSLR